jgi:hypothetical protein
VVCLGVVILSLLQEEGLGLDNTIMVALLWDNDFYSLNKDDELKRTPSH